LPPDVFRLSGRPRDAINVYLVADVLVDAATQLGHRRILRQLGGRRVGAHALTHAHPDHYGSSHAVCQALGVSLWCGARDAHVAEAGLREPPRRLTPDPARNRASARRLGALRPALVLFGHGPPLRDTERFGAFARSLAGYTVAEPTL
jgi:glyoxylase-like metal-dependent hydrolase (beta-lactamase superfamily II)